MSAQKAHREARWQSLALRRGPVASLLWPISLVYGALMSLRRRLYAAGWLTSHRLPVPVIVVGNVVVGGAGKTPTVIALVRHLQARGWRPGVVSRGHGRAHASATEVKADTPAHLSGDEPALIHRSTGVPVCVAAHRVAAARALLAAHPETDILLCDDGLQHLALERDVSIVVFDDRGVGNGWLLPAGLLRDHWPPAPGAPGKPDFLLRQHREDMQPMPVIAPPGMPTFNTVRRLADEAIGIQGERVALRDLQGTPLTAVAGIARPAVFFDMLRAKGLTLQQEIALPDHAEPAAYEALLAAGPATLICTGKDAVKLFGMPAPPGSCIWSVALELEFEPAFLDAIDERLSALAARG